MKTTRKSATADHLRQWKRAMVVIGILVDVIGLALLLPLGMAATGAPGGTGVMSGETFITLYILFLLLPWIAAGSLENAESRLRVGSGKRKGPDDEMWGGW